MTEFEKFKETLERNNFILIINESPLKPNSKIDWEDVSYKVYYNYIDMNTEYPIDREPLFISIFRGSKDRTKIRSPFRVLNNAREAYCEVFEELYFKYCNNFSGNKTEIIKRLPKEFPNVNWVKEMEEDL